MSADSPIQEPGPDGGPNADDEGEQVEQLTEEERMLADIAAQKVLIDAMPPGDTPDHLVRRAPHQKMLGQLEFQHQHSVEKKRTTRDLAKFDENYGALYSEPCLICLEDIHVHASARLLQVFLCCGGFVCKSCVRDIKESKLGLDKCPLCREPLHNTTETEEAAQFMTLAKRGVSWAQEYMGRCMIKGNGGFEKQGTTGLKWLNKAVDQNYPAALYYLSSLYRDGLAPLLDKSQAKANELLMRSANLGYALANSSLAKVYSVGSNGFEEDPDEEAIFRATVAHALDPSNKSAAMILGCHLKPEQATEPSPYLACYYLNIAANEDEDGMACYSYSSVLDNLSEHIHNSQDQIPGFNVVPAAFFWLRKSRDMGYDNARKMLKEWESDGQSRCFNCSKGAKTSEKFKQCSKCKAQWYCSKDCQVDAWKAGHKKDCKRATMLTFEDYLNAE